MAAEIKQEIALEIAHVLFIDIARHFRIGDDVDEKNVRDLERGH